MSSLKIKMYIHYFIIKNSKNYALIISRNSFILTGNGNFWFAVILSLFHSVNEAKTKEKDINTLVTTHNIMI